MSDDLLFTLRVGLTNPIYGNAIATIRAFDAHHTSRDTGHMRIDVEVILTETVNAKRTRTVVFPRGQLYCAVNRWTAIDSDAAKALVLSLVGMKKGDTDAEYFADYSPEQLTFASEYGDTIAVTGNDRYGDL